MADPFAWIGPRSGGAAFALTSASRQCLLSLNRRNKAEARRAFMTARDNARQQGATFFEDRAVARLVEMGN